MAQIPFLKNRIPPRDSIEHTKLVNRFVEWFEFSQKGRRERDEMFKRAYEHYRSYLKISKNWIYSTRLYDPVWFSHLQTLISREMSILFQGEGLWRYMPRGDSDFELAQKLTDLTAFHLGEHTSLRGDIQDLLLTRRMAGTAYAAVFWNQKSRKVTGHRRVPVMAPVPRMDPFTGMPQLGPDGAPVVDQVPMGDDWEEFREERYVVDSPWFVPLPFTECYPDHSFPTVEDGEFFIHRTLRDRRYLKNKVRSGEWDSKIVKELLDKESDLSFPEEEINTTTSWQADIGLSDIKSNDSISDRKWFEVMEIWTDNGVSVMINRSVLVARRVNPYIMGKKPILHMKNFRLPNEHYGMSDWEVIEKLVVNIQEMRNAGATEVLLSVFGMVKVSPGVKLSEVKSSPGHIMRVPEMESVEFLNRPSQGAQVAQGQTVQDIGSINEALGSSEAFRGTLPQDTQQKATSISMAVESAGQRLQLLIDNTSEELLKPLGMWYASLIQQFETFEKMVRSTEDPEAQLILVDPDELRDLDADVIPLVSVSQMQELQAKRLLEFYNIASGSQDETVNRRELIAAIADLLIPARSKKIVRSEEEIQQLQMQQQMAMMQQPQDAANPSAAGPEQAFRGPQITGGSREMANELSNALTL